LPANFLEEMDGFQIETEHLSWFLNEISVQIKKHGNFQELIEWKDFISKNKIRFTDSN
jgi:hypothetical protein